MHRSSTYLPLLALLGTALASLGCRSGQAEHQVTVSPGPVTFSKKVDSPQSRLVGAPGGDPQDNTAERSDGGETAPAKTAATKPAAAPADSPATGATASLSDAPSPDAGKNQLSAEDRAALADGLRDADPEVQDLANRLAALEIPEEAATGEASDAVSEETSAESSPVASADAEATADDERVPAVDGGNVATTAGEGTEGVDIRLAVGEAENAAASEVQQAKATASTTPTSNEPDAKVAALKTAAADAADDDPLAELTDEQIFAHLIERYEKRTVADSEGEIATNDLIALRALMVLSGSPDSAVAPIEGWQPAEQEFLSHYMLALWQLIDPQAHPVRVRRWTTGLPELRQAANYLAASTDTLEVRSLAWCTEVVWYGQITPFPSDRFVAGQEVILYSEIDNFGVERLSDGVETHLQGTYEIVDPSGKNVALLVGEVDRQKHNKGPRDYFLPYRFHLPQDLKPGKYKLQMTVEDFKSGKYGRSSIPFEITAAR